jgi:hypothetical protein
LILDEMKMKILSSAYFMPPLSNQDSGSND